ncbi:carboxy terminal-processing peptidase [Flavobacteriaceae bacterium]|jgi:carboxyl-terminal processing protease|nr:carboxy terminal-processing peptidase [Flavobacteriaceae bacterium]MDC0463500.1 carboxy terminal-processing peptidase [Flavobacteriaceae bacterium]MDC3198673.1 carboxy terminal-processing peptidase [Flavobacteriaceae bacterium]|tara:strand:- start:4515 stop:6644 length:2130 start_codon:yes stop_codon:yes gene_type:complete
MKRNFNVLLVTLLIAFASCSFTSKSFDDPDKDKLLMKLITYLLEEGHFQPKEINDDLSQAVYTSFLDQIDPFKNYFLKSDIDEFEEFKTELDNQILAHDVSFFNLVYDRFLIRFEDSRDMYSKVLELPFDFSLQEVYSTDYENNVYVNSKSDMFERWRKQLKFYTISNYYDLITADKKSQEADENFKSRPRSQIEIEARESILKTMTENFSVLEDIRRQDWLSVYINAIAVEFDPHTFYFAPSDKDRFDAQMTGKYEGIGARLQKRMDEITITELISGGSAWRQDKLEVGDAIIKVRQEDEQEAISVIGMRLDDAVKLIKGPKGSNVILTLKKVDGTIEDLSIPRDEILLEETYAKSTKVVKNGVTFGVINLPKFYIDFQDSNSRNAATDVKKEIELLKAEGMEGLVLDLRNNGGGSLKTVVDIGGLFIDQGPIVQVRSTGNNKEVLEDKQRGIEWDGPLVILVNELSASASEILAAAMQDYKRAIVIGSKQTYGKGTVQNIIDLNRMIKANTNGDMGAFKFTTQKYYRINGGSTQLEGVKSDIIVPGRFSYMEMGEKEQDNPLEWDEIEPANYQTWESSLNYKTTIENSYTRLNLSDEIKLIDDNARWIKSVRDQEVYQLNYEKYSENINLNEKESKRFDQLLDYQTDLTFEPLSYELPKMKQDSIFKINRNRWHKNLSKDIYMEEALNVLNDLNISYNNENTAQVKK